jgi:hypothetical protein
MACEWRAPCGCVIEFKGQTVDIDEPVKKYKTKCDRHKKHKTDKKRAHVALDECKQVSCVHAELEADGCPTEHLHTFHVCFEGDDLCCHDIADDEVHTDLITRAKARRKTFK